MCRIYSSEYTETDDMLCSRKGQKHLHISWNILLTSCIVKIEMDDVVKYRCKVLGKIFKFEFSAFFKICNFDLSCFDLVSDMNH